MGKRPVDEYCYFCEERHRPIECTKYKAEKSRKEIAKRKKICHLCFVKSDKYHSPKNKECPTNETCFSWYSTDHHSVFCPPRIEELKKGIFLPKIDDDLLARFVETLEIDEKFLLATSSASAQNIIPLKDIKVVDQIRERHESLEDYKDSTFVVTLNLWLHQSDMIKKFFKEQIICKSRYVNLSDVKIAAKQFLQMFSSITKIILFGKLNSEITFSDIIEKVPNIEEKMRRRLLLHDGFFLNTRQKVERKVVNPAWKPKDGKNPLRIEIADKKDLVLVANFFNHHFTSNNNLRKALGATYEDMEEFSYNRAELAVKKPRSYLAFDGNKLVAASLRTYYTKDEYFQIFNGELFHKNPTFLIKDDYAEDIRSKGYNLNASRIAVLNEACISQIGKFLPSDVENLDFEIATGVHPDYTRFGIAVVEAAYEATKKIGVKSLFCLPYKDFKENGKPVFNNIPDKCCHAMLAKPEEMLKMNEEKFNKKQSIYKSSL